jgi:hypothetical protein
LEPDHIDRFGGKEHPRGKAKTALVIARLGMNYERFEPV